MEAVAAGDQVAGDLPVGAARVAVGDPRPVGGRGRARRRRRPRTRSAAPAPSRAAIRSLTTSCCPYTVIVPAGQLGERDPVVGAVEAQREPVVRQALRVEPVAEAGLAQQFDGGMLQHARADPLLDVLAAAPLEHDGVDAGPVQQVGQHEPGGAGADDADPGARGGWHAVTLPAPGYRAASSRGPPVQSRQTTAASSSSGAPWRNTLWSASTARTASAGGRRPGADDVWLSRPCSL